MVELLLPKQKVAGSRPVSRSISPLLTNFGWDMSGTERPLVSGDRVMAAVDAPSGLIRGYLLPQPVGRHILSEIQRGVTAGVHRHG